MATLKDLGEFGLIERIHHLTSRKLPQGTVGIGDDCAVIPIDSKNSLLVTTDALVEGIHFLREWSSAEDLGYKSLAVNLSDIAAMGGAPESVFLTLALPNGISTKWVDGFFKGWQSLADEWGVALLGGDLTRAPNELVISVTALGRASTDKIRYRSGAKPGDVVCVTGPLGESAAGLKLLSSSKKTPTGVLGQFVQSQLRPRPHVREGQWLAERASVHAMMDVSDGLVGDLGHILERSKVGAWISADWLPVSSELAALCRRKKWDPHQLTLEGGEDYCLIVIVDQKGFWEVSEGFVREFGRNLVELGEITAISGQLVLTGAGRKNQILGPMSWDHFGS